MTSREITLYVPGIQGPLNEFAYVAHEDLPSLPCISKFISRARKYTKQRVLPDAYIMQLLGFYSDAQLAEGAANLLCKKNSEEESKKAYFKVEPVYLQMGHANAVLFPVEPSPNESEARQLIDVINTHFNDAPWQLHLVDSSLEWCIEFDTDYDLKCFPVREVLGQDVSHYSPTGKDSQKWLSWLNEIQMLLHEHPVNQTRLQENQSIINSIWIWGGGQAPQKQTPAYTHLMSNDQFANSLGKLNAIERFQADEFNLKSIIADHCWEHLLIIDTKLYSMIKNQDIDSWFNRMKRIEQDYFDVLISFLTQGKLQKLVLKTDIGLEYVLTRKNIKHWWKSVKPYFKTLGLANK